MNNFADICKQHAEAAHCLDNDVNPKETGLVKVELRENEGAAPISYLFRNVDDAKIYLHKFVENQSQSKSIVVSIDISSENIPDPRYFPPPKRDNALTCNIDYALQYLDIANNAALLTELIKFKRGVTNTLPTSLKNHIDGGKLAINAYLPAIELMPDGDIKVSMNKLQAALSVALEIKNDALVSYMVTKGFDILLPARKSKEGLKEEEFLGTVLDQAFSRGGSSFDSLLPSFLHNVAPLIKNNPKAHGALLDKLENFLTMCPDIKSIINCFKVAKIHNLGLSLDRKHPLSSQTFLDRIIKDEPAVLIAYLLKFEGSGLTSEQKAELFSNLSKDAKLAVYRLLLDPMNFDLITSLIDSIKDKKEGMALLFDVIAKCDKAETVWLFLTKLNELEMSKDVRLTREQIERLKARFNDNDLNIRESFRKRFVGEKASSNSNIQDLIAIANLTRHLKFPTLEISPQGLDTYANTSALQRFMNFIKNLDPNAGSEEVIDTILKEDDEYITLFCFEAAPLIRENHSEVYEIFLEKFKKKLKEKKPEAYDSFMEEFEKQLLGCWTMKHVERAFKTARDCELDISLHKVRVGNINDGKAVPRTLLQKIFLTGTIALITYAVKAEDSILSQKIGRDKFFASLQKSVKLAVCRALAETMDIDLILDLIKNDRDQKALSEVLMDCISKSDKPEFIISCLNKFNELNISDEFKFTPEQIERLHQRFEDKVTAVKERFREAFYGRKVSENVNMLICEAPTKILEAALPRAIRFHKDELSSPSFGCKILITPSKMKVIFLLQSKNGESVAYSDDGIKYLKNVAERYITRVTEPIPAFANIYEKCAWDANAIDPKNADSIKMVTVNIKENNTGVETSYHFSCAAAALSYLQSVKKEQTNFVVSIITDPTITPDPKYLPLPEGEKSSATGFDYALYYLELITIYNKAILNALMEYTAVGSTISSEDREALKSKLSEALRTSLENSTLSKNAYLPKFEKKQNEETKYPHEKLEAALMLAVELGDIGLVISMVDKGFDISQKIHISGKASQAVKHADDTDDKATVLEKVFEREDTFVESFFTKVAPKIKQNNPNAYYHYLRYFENYLAKDADGQLFEKYFELDQKYKSGIFFNDTRFMDKIISKGSDALIASILKPNNIILNKQEKVGLFSRLSKEKKLRLCGELLKVSTVDLIHLIPPENDQEMRILMEEISKCDNPETILLFLKKLDGMEMGKKAHFSSEQVKRLQDRFTCEDRKIKDTFRKTFLGQKISEKFNTLILQGPEHSNQEITDRAGRHAKTELFNDNFRYQIQPLHNAMFMILLESNENKSIANTDDGMQDLNKFAETFLTKMKEPMPEFGNDIYAKLAWSRNALDPINDDTRWKVKIKIKENDTDKEATYHFSTLSAAKHYLLEVKKEKTNFVVSILVDPSIMPDPKYFTRPDGGKPSSNGFDYAVYYLDLLANKKLLGALMEYRSITPDISHEDSKKLKSNLLGALRQSVNNLTLSKHAYLPKFEQKKNEETKENNEEVEAALMLAVELGDSDLVARMVEQGFDIFQRTNNTINPNGDFEKLIRKTSSDKVIDAVIMQGDDFFDAFCLELARIINKKKPKTQDKFLEDIEKALIDCSTIDSVVKYLGYQKKLGLVTSIHKKHESSNKSFFEKILASAPEALITHLVKAQDSKLSQKDKVELLSKLPEKEKLNLYQWLLKFDNIDINVVLDKELKTLMEVISRCDDPKVVLSYLHKINALNKDGSAQFTPEQTQRLEALFNDQSSEIKESFRAALTEQKASESFHRRTPSPITVDDDVNKRATPNHLQFWERNRQAIRVSPDGTTLKSQILEVAKKLVEKYSSNKTNLKLVEFIDGLEDTVKIGQAIEKIEEFSKTPEIISDPHEVALCAEIINEVREMQNRSTQRPNNM